MHRFTVENGKTMMDGKEFLVKGLRCSNGLYSEKVTKELIEQLPEYANHGLNSISVYVMGNRFGDIKGYHRDGTLNDVYRERFERIIEAADELGMMVIVGCLYWGETKAKYEAWKQADAEKAVRNTALWLAGKKYTNIMMDMDNEGMARQFKGFDNRGLVLAAKAGNPSCPVSTNYIGIPPEEADLGIHFSDKVPNKPYIESEGVPEDAPGGYWPRWSRFEDPMNPYRRTAIWNYNHIGIYTPEMKEDQIKRTAAHLDNGYGYMLASTWLQAVEPYGPNHQLGGDGTKENPGIRWWAEFVRDRYGAYRV